MSRSGHFLAATMHPIERAKRKGARSIYEGVYLGENIRIGRRQNCQDHDKFRIYSMESCAKLLTRWKASARVVVRAMAKRLENTARMVGTC